MNIHNRIRGYAMICMYCEERITSRFDPDVIGGHGEYVHRRCEEEARLRRSERDARSEVARLRERVRDLETQLATTGPVRRDPHDVDDDELECPHKGRIAAHYLSTKR